MSLSSWNKDVTDIRLHHDAIGTVLIMVYVEMLWLLTTYSKGFCILG